MGREEWPFVRQDVRSVPRAAFVDVLRRAQRRPVRGVLHHAQLRMHRLSGHDDHPSGVSPGRVARPLYFKTINAMRRKGLRGQVVHTTNDSARLIRLLGFRPGDSFTLLVRDPGRWMQMRRTLWPWVWRTNPLSSTWTQSFGQRRPWIGAMLRQGEAHFYGVRKDSWLVAMLALRPRWDSALCLDP